MLEIKHVYKTFNLNTINEKKALQNITLTLNDGDFVTIIGGNGAGKSTLLNMIAGVYPVDCGSIIVDGVDVTRLPEYKRAKYLGRVFQDPMTGTAADMQIEENLALAARRGKRRTLRVGITAKERKEYKAALDPKTAKKVLDITEEIVAKDNLITIMLKHNMADAIRVGNRLIMMHEGQIVVDVKGEEKKKLTIEQLLQMFEASSGSKFTSDKVMLSK